MLEPAQHRPRVCSEDGHSDDDDLAALLCSSRTVPVQPVLALTVEQKLVVNVGQQKLDAPALHAQLVLHQDDGAAVVASLGTRDHADLVSAGPIPEMMGRTS